MKKQLSRRNFIKVALAAGATAAIAPRLAFGESRSLIKFTPEIAIEYAEEFAKALNGAGNLTAGRSELLFGADGAPLGYVVEYVDGGIPHGFIVFDSSQDSLIAQFSFEESVVGPGTAVRNSIARKKGELIAEEDAVLYKVAPFTYGIGTHGSTEVDLCTGGVCSLPQEVIARSVDPSTWNDIFIPVFDNLSNYSFGDSGSIPYFIAYAEEDVKRATGRYACAVSAMLCAVEYYGQSAPDVVSEYLDLWSRSKTSTIGFDGSGHILGSTQNSNIGPALTANLSAKGISVSYSAVESPGLSVFSRCINRGDMGIFSCGIVTPSAGGLSEEGHAMAVEGYAVILDKGANRTFETLMVADGWYYGVAYVNLDFADCSFTYGITFQG